LAAFDVSRNYLAEKCVIYSGGEIAPTVVGKMRFFTKDRDESKDVAFSISAAFLKNVK